MEKIPAIVVKVVPSKIEKDAFSGKRYEVGNYVLVQEIASGALHTFINGSINGVKPELRVVDTGGNITWQRSASYNLPFFSA
jgi:hypothetical protein